MKLNKALVSRSMLAMFVASPFVSAKDADSNPSELRLKTKGGIEVSTSDGDYSFKVGGRIQLDYNGYDGVINAAEGESGSDLFFRRGRLEIKGKAKDWSYLMSYNLTGGGSIDQLNATYTGWGKTTLLTLGEQKENLGLDDTGSSKWTTGIERAMPANAFDTGNTVGVKLHGASGAFTYSLGVFKESVEANDNSLDTAFTGRLVYRPIQTDDTLVHLGAGVSLREGSFNALGARLGARGGEDRTANRSRVRYANGLAGDEMQIVNLEAAAVFGPAHIQAEYFDAEVSGAAAPDLQSEGYYLQVGWALTGEQRSYKNGLGAFDKIKPAGSGGAWELFARYDGMDAGSTSQDANITFDGGQDANTLTVGANWYMNSFVKFGLNYVSAQTDQPINGEDDGDAIVGRFQIAF